MTYPFNEKKDLYGLSGTDVLMIIFFIFFGELIKKIDC